MNEPLGYTVGNTVEVIEAAQFLRGTVQNPRLKTLVITLCTEMYKLYLDKIGKSLSDDDIEKLILDTIDSGKAYESFKAFVDNQGGDTGFIDNIPDDLKSLGNDYVSSCSYELKAKETGVISGITAHTVGRASLALGAGRMTKEDSIDMGAGIVLYKTVSEPVEAGDVVAVLYAENEERLEAGRSLMEQAVSIEKESPQDFDKGIIICKKN